MKIDYRTLFAILLHVVLAVGGEKLKSQRQTKEPQIVFPTLEEIPELPCVNSDGSEGSCRPAGLCVFRFDSISQSELSACRLENTEIGVCCPKKPPPTRGTGPGRPEPEGDPLMPNIYTKDLASAGAQGLSTVQQIDQLETELRRKGLLTEKGTTEHFHQSFFGAHGDAVAKLGRDGLIGVEATLRLVKAFQLDSDQSRDGLRRFSLDSTVIQNTCPKAPSCPPTKYRTIDGSCNNLNNPAWGKSYTAYNRMLPPRYADGINSPRVSYDGGPLPSAREVSYKTLPNGDHPSNKFTLMLMQFGQFIAHEITRAAGTKTSKGEGITCCHPEIQKNQRLLHPACLPIYISSNDPFYSQFGKTCMEFVRSSAAPRPDCTFGHREQLNQNTAFIDGSVIYGSTENETKQLRSFEGGQLKITPRGGKELLSVETDKEQTCSSKDPTKQCFAAGDSRVNMVTTLTTMHTIWLREHNRIARKLSRLNPGWNDEILFRESRRMIGAELQQITYMEYLPVVLGGKVMSSYKLAPQLEGYNFDYEPKINPSINNGFAAAGYRMGHSLVQSDFELIEESGIIKENILLSSQFNNPKILYRNGSVTEVARGLTEKPCQKFDKFITSQLTEHLLEMPGNGYGLDLASLNMQRGRDHGIPGYNEWREYCGLPRIQNFEDLATVIDPEAAGNFSRIYRSVDDLDLYAAGLAEHSLPDAIVGPTFACIIAEQFRRLKTGDRFFYENGGLESSFTKSQLAEIRKVTLSGIICGTTEIGKIPLVAFIRPALWNPVLSCESIPKVNLNPWKNEPVWT